MALALITYLRREAEERAPHKLMLIDTFKELPLLTLAEEDRIRVTELLSLEGAVTPKPFWMARAIRVEGRTTAQRSSLCRQRGTAARLRKPARVVHRYTPSVTPKSRPVLIRVLDNSPRVTIHPKNCRRAFSESSKRNHQGLSGF
jgi:hypothetical protein